MSVFVDTNVLVYAQDAADDRKRLRAQEWMSTLWASAQGRLSTQVLNEYYVTVTRKLRPRTAAAQARLDVRDLLAWNPVAVDSRLVLAAWDVEERYGFSYWDALIVAAAQIADCEYLLTEDLSDGQRLDRLTVVNPFSHEPQSLI